LLAKDVVNKVADEIVKKVVLETEDSDDWMDIRKFGIVRKRPLAFSKRAELPLQERKMRQLDIVDALSRITS